MKKHSGFSFRYFFPLAIAVAGLSLLVYLLSQQVLRQSANDPQIQLAQDTALALSQGQTPTLPGRINISQSLAPFVIIYDENGHITSSSAMLDGETPPIPSGVFSYAKEHGENRVTWQPAPGVRSAIVVKHFNGGYVVAGRSLREVEKREDQLSMLTLLGFAGTEGTLLVVFIILAFI